MSAFRPILPPKAGYVEVLAEDGVTHIYKPTPETVAQMNRKDAVWDELDAAYREGVNSAYDS